jgi:predicted negative regulator of RcsB-dependent stress response
MKKIFLLLLAFSITPMYLKSDNTEDNIKALIVTSFISIASFISYRIYHDHTTPTNTIPQPHAIVSTETNTNKNEEINNPITTSNKPKESNPQSINHSIEQNNSIIEDLIDQKQHNKEPEINQTIQDFINDNQQINEPKEKPNLQEIITKPKTKPNNITLSKYPTEKELDILYGN